MDVDPEHRNPPSAPHEVLWLPDGNVILATESFLFKVHKSILSMQSSVFKDMLDPPTVDGSEIGHNGAWMMPEQYEGLPLVTLVGDKGQDVEQFMSASACPPPILCSSLKI